MPTLGLTSTGTVSEGITGDSETAWYIGQMPEAGTLVSITVDIDSPSNPATCKAALLSGPDAGTSPPTTIIAEIERTALSGRSQYVFTAASEALSSGAHLWIMVAKSPIDFTGIVVYQSSSTGAQARSASITYPTLDPNPTSGFGLTNIIAAYITYSTGGGGSKLLLQMANY